MKDVKFRGLTTKGEMIFGSLVTATHGLSHKQAQMTKTWIIESAFANGGWFCALEKRYVKPETVGQLTGEKDDDGVEIYEGDKIQKTAMITGDHDFMGVVVFKEGSFWIDNESKAIRLFCETAKLKVIGNIHQNQELMGVK